MFNGVMKKQSLCHYGRPCKKRQRQGAQGTRREAYFCVRRNNEGRSVIPILSGHMDFLRGCHAK
jgi:hypothetical protein